MKKQIIASAISAFVGASPIVAQSQTSEPLDERGYVIPDMNIVINPRDKTIVIPFEIVSGAAITYTNVGHNIYNCRSKILIVHRPDQFPSMRESRSNPETSEKIQKVCQQYLP